VDAGIERLNPGDLHLERHDAGHMVIGGHHVDAEAQRKQTGDDGALFDQPRVLAGRDDDQNRSEQRPDQENRQRPLIQQFH